MSTETVTTNVYEGLFILDANRFARDHDAVSEAVEKLVTELGGEVLVSRLWEERRLAYPINGHRKGAYWLMYFRINPLQITALNRACELHDSVLRQLVLKIHPRLVEPILAHATGAVSEEEAEAEGEAAQAVAPAAEG
ncbi:30S ribosomal protein S6 [Pirellulimonas nuda]|uniref:Small ribosomal subunit protein bS6 n=1 Tax=Pirellulimonas nuda TaxID=2528009 RepID=A0A518D8K7_9BACT|nr:30S ribosomal protein S6 [Pirellulimonas nuda]QDU87805.1 30S ribosomal protein S6 [Pirellulimonas nuda]